MALSVASTLRSEGGRTVRDAHGFKVAKWAPAPRQHDGHLFRAGHCDAGRRVIGLTHNYDVAACPPGHRDVVLHREVHPPVRHVADRVAHSRTDLREREFVDEETFSHVEHVPVRVQERVVHRTREVPKPVPVPQYIEVPKPYPVDRIVEVPKYIEKRVEVPVEVERIVEVPRPYPVEVIKRVEVPVEIERIVEKIVPVDRPVHIEHRVEVPVREEVWREIERPVRDAVPVHVPDPRQSAAIANLQRELNAAHTELNNLRGGRHVDVVHRGVTHHEGHALHGAHTYHDDHVLHGRGVHPGYHGHRRTLHDAHHHRLHPHRHHNDDVVGLRGRMPVDDVLLHQHPTEKWGRMHDIPGRRPFPADPFYRLHAERV